MKQQDNLVLTALIWLFAAMCIMMVNGCRNNNEPPMYKNPDAPIEKRIDDLLDRMTLQEKILQLSGTGFETPPLPRLGIPVLKMSDGPVGIRYGKATAFPSGVGLAATWNPVLIKKIAAAIARETKSKGRNVLLGPCVNIHRHPLGGRNFESYGEDPFLASRMAVAFVKGVQEQGVIASVKHFACNNHELNRMNADIKLSERALREIYFPAYKAAVKKAGAWSVMAAYNKIDGKFCSENNYLLNNILKKEWGFRGFVVSDWDGTHSTVPAALAGLDIEMPTGKFFGQKLLEAVKNGKVNESVIDDKIRRLMRVRFQAGLFDSTGNSKNNPGNAVSHDKHRPLALDAAIESIVLLKNEKNTLPLDKSNIKTIAVIGPNAAVARTGGGGSSRVTPVRAVSPLEGIKRLLGKNVTVLYNPGVAPKGELIPVSPRYVPGGWKGEYFDNPHFKGNPIAAQDDQTIDFSWQYDGPVLFNDKPGLHNNFSVRWTGEITVPSDGIYHLSVLHNNMFRITIDDQLIMGQSKKLRVVFKGKPITLVKGKKYRVKLEYVSKSGLPVMKFGMHPDGYKPVEEAVKIAKQADAVIICAGLNGRLEGEGADRQWLGLPNQDILIAAVAEANPRTIVVINTGGPVAMSPWLPHVPAVLQAWYPGQEGGDATAKILFGDAVPSGKLPVSFIKSSGQTSTFNGYKKSAHTFYYDEEIFVGYRYLDKHGMAPNFPFGHGLSYAEFQYSGLSVTPSPKGNYTVSLDLKNTGNREGAEIVQVYVRDIQSTVERPIKELKGFEKISLKPGETRKVSIILTPRAFSFFHPVENKWTTEPGAFEILVGSSSRDIRLKKEININP